MTIPCELRPVDKRKLVNEVGKQLVREHGKRRYYTPTHVREAAQARGYGHDLHCWAMCVFTSPGDFEALHAAAGELCNYAAMRASVLGELATHGASGAAEATTAMLENVDLSWLEWPDVDWSSLFEWFDFS